MKLRALTPTQIANCHRQILDGIDGKRQTPTWARRWLIAAVTPQTEVHDAYRQNGWDLEHEIRSLRGAFTSSGEYFVENAAADLRQMRRRLLRRYAFSTSSCIEAEAWKREKEVLQNDAEASGRDWANLYLFRFWRLKDGLMLRVGIAVQLGFAVLASSSGLTQALNSENFLDSWGLVLGIEMFATFALALVDVQKQAGRRDWLSVLALRALIVTVAGAAWSIPGGVLYYRTAPSLHQCPRPLEYFVLCSSTAVLLGFVFQLFWQEDSIAEPL